jgi:hypothetical protein
MPTRRLVIMLLFLLFLLMMLYADIGVQRSL